MQLSTLGKLELSDSGLRRPKLLLLLAFLTVEGSKSRADLAEFFYLGARSPSSSLRVALNHFKADAEGAVLSEAKRVTAVAKSDAQALLDAFEVKDYGLVTELYKGAFLDGFSLKDWPVELEEWVYVTREHIASTVRQSLLILAQEQASQANFSEAAKLAGKAFKLAGASEPEPEQLELLYTLMLTSDSAHLPELKNLLDDYGLSFELSQEDAQAQFKTTTSHKKTPSNVLARGNSFVGRQDEIKQITTLLNDPNYRLLTLHGQGGIGKTRLVTRTALKILETKNFNDGVFLTELESLNHHDEILEAIANSLELQVSNDDSLTAITKHIANKQFLLVLDNFDHLVEGSPLCSTLLQNCPNLKILVSSRERLNITEEYGLEIKGLNVPPKANLSLEEAKTYSIITLFEDRAKRAKLEYSLNENDIEAVISIAQLVEGLPLGVELAAAGIAVMNATEIAQAITQDIDTLYTPARDVTERHQSIRATFDYSWNLLNPKEQDVLKNLSICVGGFTRDAASKIANANIPTLRGLIDKALLRVNNSGRYSCHMLLYQFTQEKLEQDPNKTQEKHAQYYNAYAQEAEPHLINKGQLEWLKKLETDKDNLRKSLRWNLTNDLDSALRQAAALRRFWEIRGYFTEGTSWLKDCVNKASDQSSEVYLKAIYALAALLRAQHNTQDAQPYLNACITLAKKLNQQPILADTYNLQAGIAWAKGDLDESRDLLNKSLEIKRELNDRRGVAISLENLGLLAKRQKNHNLALTLYQESYEIYTNSSDDTNSANALRNIGQVLSIQNNFDAAKNYLEKSLASFVKMGNKQKEGWVLNDLACIACHNGDLNLAIKYLDACNRITKMFGTARDKANVDLGYGLIAYAKENYNEAHQLFKKALKQANSFQDLTAVATALEGLGCSSCQIDNHSLAAKLWGASDNLQQTTELIKTFLKTQYESDITKAKNNLGESSYLQYYEVGRHLPLEEAIHLALEADAPTLNLKSQNKIEAH